MKLIKKLSVFLSILLMIPLMNLSAETKKATVIKIETGHRKVVEVGDIHAFDGGYTLEISMYEAPKKDKLGYSVVTDYKTTTNVPMSISQSYIPVSSLITKDGHTLTIEDVGKVFLILESGRSKEEIVMCEGLDSALRRWTNCTRGLSFYGKSLASNPDNIQSHSSGSSVLMSNVHYVYDQFVNKDEDQTIGGEKTYTGTTTFSIIPRIPTDTPTLPEEIASKDYVDGLIIAGGVDASSLLKGISKLSLDPATSTEPIAVGDNDTRMPTQDENDALVGTAGTSSASNPFVTNDDTVGTGDIERISISSVYGSIIFGDGLDGDVIITATTTISSDKFYNNLTINDGVELIPNGYRIYVKGTLTYVGTGKINGDGGDGGDGTNGTGNGTTVTLGVGGAAGIGNINGVSGKNGVGGHFSNSSGNISGISGNNGISSTYTIGGKDASVGGSSYNGTDNGGAGGTSLSATSPINLLDHIILFDYENLVKIKSYPSGGGGAVGGAYYGSSGITEVATGGSGGSGASAGIVFVSAKNIITVDGNNYITANGGKGGKAGDGYANEMGGGTGSSAKAYGSGGASGGNGGLIVLIYLTKINSGTTSFLGGISGQGGQGMEDLKDGVQTVKYPGNAGVNGLDGEILELNY